MARLTHSQKIGAFIILTLLSLFLIINFLRGSNIFNKQNHYYSFFDNVEGLSVSGPVNIRGLRVGKVTGIKYIQEDNIFEVRYSIEARYNIPIDSKSEIYSSDLLGGKALRINLGRSSNVSFSGDTLSSGVIPDLLTILSGEILPVKDQLTELIVNLNSVASRLNSILDQESEQNIKESLNHLNNSLSNISSISEDLNMAMPSIDSILNNVANLTEKLSHTLDSLDLGISEISGIARNVSQSNIKETINSLHQILDNINNSEGTLNKIIDDTSIYDSINDLVIRIDTLIKNIEKNPKKYLKISVF